MHIPDSIRAGLPALILCALVSPAGVLLAEGGSGPLGMPLSARAVTRVEETGARFGMGELREPLAVLSLIHISEPTRPY